MGQIHKIRAQRSRFGFIIRTKDRCDISRQTIQAAAAEKAIDLYWLDGSSSDEGQLLAETFAREGEGLCEVHTGINFGHAGSFAYGVQLLLEKNYPYLGFLDGDVLAEPGWFDAMFSLYERGRKDGLDPGMVSSRSIQDRVLVPRDGYAVVTGVGAGFTMITREVCLILLKDESDCFFKAPTFLLSQIWQVFKEITGVDYPLRNKIRKSAIEELKKANFDPNFLLDWHMSTDWWWEVILLKRGMVSLATTPSLARNIDEDGAEDAIIGNATKSDPTFNWQDFVKRLNDQRLKHERAILKEEPATRSAAK